MITIRHLTLAAVAAAFSLSCQAQAQPDHSAHRAGAAASASADGAATGRMDEHMKRMREMHEKMTQAKTPEERSALMSEHMKLMQDGMAMMGGRGAGGMPCHGGKPGKGPMHEDMAAHHEMMEKRMEMMQSMMQMMLDRMSAAPAKQ
ncbi:MAG: hypothetical protein Q7T97_00260 [Burkholderiaceae bacterium]|nr:hypothetical protein [Burkholderiaceae bacterium]